MGKKQSKRVSIKLHIKTTFLIISLLLVSSSIFISPTTQTVQASAPIDHLTISINQINTISGANLTGDVVVTAYDANGNVITDYKNSVYFTSSDQNAILPLTYTFTPSDAGKHTFKGSAFTFNTVGNQSLTVNERPLSIFDTPATGASVNITVCAKLVFTMYAMSLSPSDISHSVTAGNTTSQFIVQRQNGYANTVTSGWNNIYLQTTSPTGKFYYINGSLITPYTPSNNHQVRDALPSILLRDGYGGLRFRYSDTTSGNWTITAWSDGTCPYVPSGFNSSYSMTNITYPDGTFGLKYSIGQPVQSASTTIHVLPIAQSVGISARVQFNSTQFTNYLLPQKYNITIQLNNNGYIPVDDGLNNTILDGNVFVEMTAMSEFWFSNGTTYTPWQNIEFYSPPNMFFPEMYINQTIYTSLGFPLVLDGNWHDGFNAPCYYIPPTLSAGVQLTKVTFSFKLTVYSEVTWLGETSSSSGDGIDLGMYMILRG